MYTPSRTGRGLMISWVKNLFKSKKKKHDEIVGWYRSTASVIGGVLAMPFNRENTVIGLEGRPFRINDPELYHLLHEYEVAYAELGYRIISLQDWIDHGGWKVSMKHLLLVKRDKNERPVFTKYADVPELPQRHPNATGP